MPATLLDIAGRPVGRGAPCLVIAEAGVNHNGRRDEALRLIDAAADAGADAVKFQTFRAANLVTAAAPKAAYQLRQTGAGESQLEMLRRLELSADDHRALQVRCRERGVLFLSSPFDEEAADLLADLQAAAFKIPSGEITNTPYLRHVAALGKPLIVSTGMCGLGEVEAAVAAIEAVGDVPYVLLHCVSNYPADPAETNLRAMDALAAAFGAPVGYSDHTLGIEVALAAVARGACVLEKHFTLDRSAPGPDHAASLEPGELAALVRGVRTIEAALGDGRKRCMPGEQNTAAVARKSLVAARDLAPGSALTDDALAARRPGGGLAPSLRPHVVGRRVRTAIPAGAVLQWEMLQ